MNNLHLFLWLWMTITSQAIHRGHNSYQEIFEKQRDTCGVTEDQVEDAFKICEPEVEERKKRELKLVESGRIVKRTPLTASLSLIRYEREDGVVKTCEDAQTIFELTMEELYKKYRLTQDDVRTLLPNMQLDGANSRQARQRCEATLPTTNCDRNSKYRTINGQCNNLENTNWGSALVCQQRLLPATYVGQSGFRQSYVGGPLPEPRTLSQNVHNHLNRPTNYVTHMYMFFGQLLDHDITLTPQSTTLDNEAIECCPPSDTTHPQCAPINIPRNDPFYSQFNVTCLNFVRSAICPTCRLGLRQQMNQLTSFIDASFVYGVSQNESMRLRRNDGTGRLRSEESAYGDLLPTSPDPQNDQCSFPDTNDLCFDAGDPRANQHTTLASLQTIFLRYHNRLATGLRSVNPQWDDETTYQEARRILGAVMQVITYKEYLPITLGRDRMDYFNLWMRNRGQTNYDSGTNPTMYNEFTTAAFRFGHSLVNILVSQNLYDENGQPRQLRNEFFQPFQLRRGLIDPLISDVSRSPAQWFDRHLVPDVTNFLYRIRGNQTGLDLASINIQRGRDHGMPPYVDMVRYCSEGKVNPRTFSDLGNMNLMPWSNVRVLEDNYRHVRDIDLWTGILSEIPNEGAVVGPTAACIIGVQFHNLKFGDRFYFEHRIQQGSFTTGQLEEVRKLSLSKVICLNTFIKQMPLNAMLFSSRNNPMITCNYVRDIDLSLWKA